VRAKREREREKETESARARERGVRYLIVLAIPEDFAIGALNHPCQLENENEK
jgi:hypothetical protein